MTSDYLAEIEKKYGPGAVTVFDGKTPYQPLVGISTGSFRLNHALGNGGVPCGRITEFYGPFSGGKSTVMQHVMANAQIQFPDKLVGIVDAEVDSFDPSRAQDVFGMDLTRVQMTRPLSGEMAYDVVESWLRSGKFSVIGIDSIASLVPQAESAADFDKNSIGLLARLNTRAMRQLGPLVARSGTALILINQIRVNIGGFIATEGRSGGHALDHTCSLIVRFGRLDFIKDGSEVIGIEVKAAVTKNKVAPPKREAQFKLYFATGIDTDAELVSVGLDSGVIVKSGNWYKYQGNNIGNGERAAASWLKEHPEVKEEIGRAG